ncbi:MAG TPA: PAS domain S-box protein [Roseiflexaceae bacterium]|nr:PAS domain S-box protein [Roseiflexaceae bacterium]
MRGINLAQIQTDTLVLAGGGEMGALMRSIDWARTPLGPIEGWPQSLRTSVSVCLHSSVPILLWWGPELVMLYNDAYRPLLGATKHPQAIGRAGREVWPEIWESIGPMLEGVLASGAATCLDDQLLLLDRNGYVEECYFSFSYSPIHDEAGKVGGIFCAATETTKRTEQALQISESRLRMAVQAGAIGIWDIDLRSGMRIWSDEAKAIYGLAPHEPMDYERQLALIHPDDRERVHALVTAFRDEGTLNQLDFEHRIARRDGSLRWVAVRGEAIYDGGPLPVRLIGTIIDITERMQAEQRLDRLQQITAALGTVMTSGQVADTIVQEVKGALSAPAGIVFLLSQDGTMLEQLTSVGYRKETTEPWVRIPLSTRVPISDCVTTGEPLYVESLEEYAARYPERRAIAEREGFAAFVAIPLKIDARVVGALGITFMVPRAFSAGDQAFIEAVARQCAQALERARLYEAEQQARAKLQERERHLHLALESARMVAWTWDSSHNRVETTDGFAAIYGLSKIEYAEQGFALLHPDDRERHQQTVKQAVETLSRYHSEFRIIRPDTGQTVWMEERAVPLLDPAGQLQGLAGVVADITERRRADEALRASEARYRELANAMPQLVWTSDANGVVDYYNSRVGEYAGIVRSENGSWDWQPVLHPDDLQPTLEAWQESTRNGRLYAFEHRIQMKDRSFRWHLSRAVPARDPDGRFVKWFGTATDIHEQHQVAQDARCLADIGEIIRLTADAEAMLAQVTQVLGEYLQIRRCMVIEIYVPENRGVVRQQYCRGVPPVASEYQLTEYSEVAQIEIDMGRTIVNVDSQIDPRTAAIYETTYHPHGERAYVAVPLMRNGKRNGTLWVSDDQPRRWEAREVLLLETVAERVWLAIERLRAEQALRANEERLQTLYIQEQAARAQAEAASRLKDEFLATVSHELRTPLTSILGYGQIIQTRKRDEAYVARTIEKIVRSAKAQAQLIDDLLDVARIITGKLRVEPRPIDMSAVIQAAIEALRPAIDAKAIRLELDMDAGANAMIGDPDRLQQVVWNLVSNAVKFTPSGGRVQMRFAIAEHLAQLTIADTGQGISPEFLPYVFDRFRQAESTSTRAYGGLGLGLAIVRHLVEMHGGTVHAESPGPGHGATFTVRLPIVEDESTEMPHDSPGAPDAAPYPPELRGLRVLIVDDQPDIVELVQDMLTPGGVIIRTAAGARDALAMLRDWRPDVLVSDIAMPGEDGYWLIRNVRALAPEAGSGTPAVALTAYVRLEDRMQVLAAGFQLYVPKPVEPAELIDAVARLARTQAADQE